jgi:hypothetical protein
MIIRGDQIVLECRVTLGVPEPKVLWFKDGRQLGSDRFMQIQGGRLTIRSADESDAGTYACKAENLAGSEIKPITLGIGSKWIRVRKENALTYRKKKILCKNIHKQNLIYEYIL